MGYAGPKAVSKVNMILKDKSCGLPGIKGLGNPLKYKSSPITFNPALKAASEAGKLTGKFKAAVDAAPTKKKGCKKKRY
jgi:hypothetical protein